MKYLLPLFFLVISVTSYSQLRDAKVDKLSKEIEKKVIEWRRYIHQNPELSNREFKTAAFIAKELRKMNIVVNENIAKTGVVGILKGDKKGKVVALRADIDALPVTEVNDLPFKSIKKTVFNDKETGIMHACGHDSHVAMLLGTASVLSKMKRNINGTIKFIFQPAEEGAPKGEEGGAELMIKEGVLENPRVNAIFGLHINSGLDIGKVRYKPMGIMASSQSFEINVKGKQAHGSRPWSSVDPIVISAQIINSIQTIVSRESDLTKEGAVITVGMINSGIRHNIIPETARMTGTIRTLDYDMQKIIHRRMKEIVPAIAKLNRGSATITIDKGYPITYNNVDLTAQMLPTLKRIVGDKNVIEINAITGAEDFSFFQQKIPGLYFFIGGKNPDTALKDVGGHHTPYFKLDERGFITGVKTMTSLALDYLNN